MKKTFLIALKEIRGFAVSPVSWVTVLAAVAVFNVFFYFLIDQNQEAALRDVFSVMEFLFIFFIPLLTMCLLAEEKSRGTLELLLTTPTRPLAIVLGKFLGTWLFVILMLSVAWMYYFIMMFFSRPDLAETLCGWTGLVLESGFFIAVGMMCSSWTKHQLAAALGAMFILFVLFLLPAVESYASAGLAAVIRAVGMTYHLEGFTTGLFGISDVVYYCSGIVLSLTVARYAAESRLWH